MPSGKLSSKPNNRNRHEQQGGNICNDVPALLFMVIEL